MSETYTMKEITSDPADRYIVSRIDSLMRELEPNTTFRCSPVVGVLREQQIEEAVESSTRAAVTYCLVKEDDPEYPLHPVGFASLVRIPEEDARIYFLCCQPPLFSEFLRALSEWLRTNVHGETFGLVLNDNLLQYYRNTPDVTVGADGIPHKVIFNRRNG